jgi:putative flavoprotein involved in K+ transport
MTTNQAEAPVQPSYDVVVIGAGQAGLAVSYFLDRQGVEHVVLERGRIGESWRTQRWDSFVVNTPNAINALPGAPYDGPAPDGFHTRDELVASFERYAERFELPIRSGIEVEAVENDSERGGFTVRARDADGARKAIAARCVVVASGILNKPRTPDFAGSLPPSVMQVHAGSYRNPQALPPGAVVVAGSGQSGCQIAEELAESGRKVYLCTSRVPRQPRRYRGRDIVEWEWDAGILHVERGDLEDPSIMTSPQPQISGVGRYGHTISLQLLSSLGVQLLGRIIGVRDGTLSLDDSLRDNIRFADRTSEDDKRVIDEYIARNEIDAPAREADAADAAWEDLDGLPMPSELDLAAADVGSIVWCTGFSADFSWVVPPILDDAGKPAHDRGVAHVHGIYFVGFPWLHRRKSGIICGVEEDASHVVDHITAGLGPGV